MPRKAAGSASPSCAVDLPMALKVLEDLLARRVIIYPADMHKRHGGKREAWYKVCAAMAAADWLAEAVGAKDKGYRAGPKCYALGDSAVDGLSREHDLVADTVIKLAEQVRHMERERSRLRREREQRDQLTIDPSPQMSQRWDISGTDTERTEATP